LNLLKALDFGRRTSIVFDDNGLAINFPLPSSVC
jgi:hypothetical protein